MMDQVNKKIILWGSDELARCVAQNILQDKTLELVAIRPTGLQQEHTEISSLLADFPNLSVVTEVTDLMGLDADVVLFTAVDLQDQSAVTAELCQLLVSGKNLLSLYPFAPAQIQWAAEQGASCYATVNFLSDFMLLKFAGTLQHAFSKGKSVKITQYMDVTQLPDAMASYVEKFGFNQNVDAETSTILERHIQRLKQGLLYGQNKANVTVNIKKSSIDVNGLDADLSAPKQTNLIEINLCCKQDHQKIELVECWYSDVRQIAQHPDLVYANFKTGMGYCLALEGEPSAISTQIEFSQVGEQHPWLTASVQLMLASIEGICDAEMGYCVLSAAPHYQQDQRLNIYTNQTQENHTIKQTPQLKQERQEPFKVVIWGPGEIGGAVVREALQRRNIEIVAAKIFSPHKNGQDLGRLVGLAPLGVKATISAQEILAMQADCVIVTPQPKAIVEGLDQQVIALLKSGKNVITSAAYHNVTMPNWLMSSQKPSALLNEITQINGLANNKKQQVLFQGQKVLWQVLQNFPKIKKATDQLLDIAQPLLKQVLPLRASPQALLKACQQGQVCLHGTGVHPSFMAERVGLAFKHLIPNIQHMRFIEAVDFSFMPDGMWGGLNTIGFGLPIEQLNEDFIVARAGDFYYGDVTGNVAHLLYGIPSDQVQVVRHFRAIPAPYDFKVGSTLIKKGHAMALHMTHEGYIKGEHFFTNEECWYLGPDADFKGQDLPFEHFKTPISYTVQIKGLQNQINMQLSMDGRGKFQEILQQADIRSADQRCQLGQQFKQAGVTNPITNATATAILDAVEAVCSLPAGIVIDDIGLRFKAVRQA